MFRRFLLITGLLVLWLIPTQAASNLLEIPDVESSPGARTRIPIMLRNQDPVTAIEFTIREGNGWYADYWHSDLEASDRLTDTHLAKFNSTSDGLRVLIYSSDNSPIKGADGIVAYIPIEVNSALEEGAVRQFEISDYLLVRPDGTNAATGFSAGALMIKETPDLTPRDIEFASQSAIPDEPLTVRWTVDNIGSHPSLSGFRETVELVATDSRQTIYLGDTRYEETIQNGASVKREATFNVPSIPGIDGYIRAKVTLYPYSDCGESISARDNNSAESQSTAFLTNKLALSLPYNITEGATGHEGYVMRAGSTESPLTVTLSLASPDTRVSIPRQVIIPAYYTGVSFGIEVAADDTYQDDTSITIVASADGIPDTRESFIVSDGAEPEFTLIESDDSVTEGGTVGFTLSRNIRATDDLTVSINCERPQLFRYPSSLIFPAGETEMEFTVEAIDNNTIATDRSVLFQASAPGYASGRTYVMLIDDDMPDISLSLSPSSVAEDAGPTAILATVRRISGSSEALRLRISSDMANAVFHESSLTLDKDVNETTFPIGIIDNTEAEGDRIVSLTASIFSSDCGCWTQESQKGYVSTQFTITDNDGPALSMSAPATLSEGKDITVTVRRNTSALSDLNIVITSEQDGNAEITFPATVTIPAGAQTVDFTLSAPANERENDSAIVSLYASADGYSLGSCRVMVTDASLPDAVISDINFDSAYYAPGDKATLTITVANEGNAVLPARIPVTVYIDGNEAATCYTDASLSSGAKVAIVKDITLPSRTGSVYVKAMVNPARKFTELIYANNESAPVSASLDADVQASVNLVKNIFAAGEDVGFSGSVSRGIRPGEPIEIYFINDGLRTSIRTETDSEGHFEGIYTPYATRNGRYDVAVAYPGAPCGEPIASFDVTGFTASEKFGRIEVDENEAFTHSLILTNPCSFPLTGISATLPDGLPEGISNVEVPCEANPGESIPLTVTTLPLKPTQGSDWQTLRLAVTSAEGATLDYILYYYVHSLRGRLQLSESNVSTTMTLNSERLYTVTLTNMEKGETGPVTITLPDADWMSLASPSRVPSLKAGESCDISLRLSPTPDMQLNNPVTATVAINAENANGAVLTVKAEPVSEATGLLRLDVCDEYTYYTSEGPHVEGATVSIMHPSTRKVLHTLTTDSSGIAEIEIPEGYYYVSVTEPRHSGYENMLLVDPGKTTLKTVNLGLQGVSIDISYEQTEIEDEYKIVTTVKYETNVPIPVVETILPDKIDIDELAPGESMMFNAILTNKGLITALGTTLEMAEYDDPDFSFSVIGDVGFDLLPGESRVIPVVVSRRQAAAGDEARIIRRSSSGGGSCYTSTFVWYESYCGSDGKIHHQKHSFPVRTCASGPLPDGGGGGWGGGWSLPILSGGSWGPGFPSGNGGGGSSWLNALNEKAQEWTDKFESFVCDPCTQQFMDAVATCRGYDPQHPFRTAVKQIPVIGDLADCGFGLADCKAEHGDYSLSNCAGAYFSCALDLCTAIGATLQGVGQVTAATGVGVAAGAAAAGAGTLIKAICEKVGDYKDGLECAGGLLKPCENNNSRKAAPALGLSDTDEYDYEAVYPSYVAQYARKLSKVVNGQQAIMEYYDELLGYPDFDDATATEIAEMFEGIQLTAVDGMIDADALRPFAPDCVPDEILLAFVQRQNNTRLKSLGLAYDGPTVDIDRLNLLSDRIGDTVEFARSLGYEGVGAMMTDARIQMEEGYEDTSGSVCSSVTLAIEQRMTMTRQAIRGTLTVVNGHESATLTDFKCLFNVYDEEGNLVGADRLQLAVEDLDGFSGDKQLDAGWNLPNMSEGVAKILFIPTRKAAPDHEMLYTFTGNVTYTDPFSGLEVTRPLTPATLSIYPSPELYLTYFMQRDIIGDDPLTPNIVESSVPAEFALIIANNGKGDAANVSLSTAQPKIIDNEKGLALDMRFIESYLNGEEASIVANENIANDFGTIPAGSTAYAQWMIESNLLGHFVDYDVEVTHVSSYDNPDLSLVDGAEIHELIHGMTLPQQPAGEDLKTVRAFVTNDVKDALDSPDRIYFSDGRLNEAVYTTGVADIRLEGLNGTLSISPMTPGWQYFSIPDPTFGLMEIIDAVCLSDGRHIPVDNFRQTDRTLRDGHEPIYEYMLHGCLKAEGNEEYSIMFAIREDTPLTVEEWSGIPAEGSVATSAVTEVGIRFNAPINPASFTPDVLRFLWQGQPSDIGNMTVKPGVSDDSFVIGLADMALSNGYYQLSVDLTKLENTDGLHGAGWARCGWVMVADGKIMLSVNIEPEDAGEVSGFGSVEPGTDMTLTAVANPGYNFTGWLNGSEILSNEPTFEFTPSADTELTARFSPVIHDVKVLLSNDLAGTLTGASSGFYSHGSEISLDVQPVSGWIFTGWILADGKDESVISTSASCSFTVDADMVITARLEKEIPSAETSHVMNLREGWSWISFPLNNELMDNAASLLSSLDAEVICLASASGNLTRVGNDWEGTLTTLSHLDGYRIKIGQPAALTLNGVSIPQSYMTVTLETGLNMIGAPLDDEVPLDVALASMPANEGDAILGHDELAVFNGAQWIGSLHTLKPGAGYVVKVAERTSFNWPTHYGGGSSFTTPSSRYAYNWDIDPARFDLSMGIIARLESDDPDISPERFLLLALDNDSGECMGISEEHDGLHFLVTHSTSEATRAFSYVAVDPESGDCIAVSDPTPTSFRQDVIGSVAQPLLLRLGRHTNVETISDRISVYPNPVIESLHIDGISDRSAELLIIDNDGRLHMRHHGLEQHSVFNLSDMANGIYRLIIRSNGETAVKTIIKD